MEEPIRTQLFFVVGQDYWIKLVAAIFCGAFLGIEREFKGKPSGLKTNILICIGSMMFAHLAIQVAIQYRTIDPTRVLGQIVTGIGFLGAGAIFSRRGSIMGLTSAAVTWVNAGVGAAIGYGFISESVILSCLTVLVILGVRKLERSFLAKRLFVAEDNHYGFNPDLSGKRRVSETEEMENPIPPKKR